jgi:hypothetical protein
VTEYARESNGGHFSFTDSESGLVAYRECVTDPLGLIYGK